MSLYHPVDRAVAIPRWPDGTYGLPKPDTGCPGSQFTWAEGTRYQDAEDNNGYNKWGNNFPFPLAGDWVRLGSMEQQFCIKTLSREAGSSGPMVQWPPGSYCIFKYGTCPTGVYI